MHMSKDMTTKQLSELNHRGLLCQNMVSAFGNTSENFSSLTSELFFLSIGHGAITVYTYLLYCEDRHTHRCHPSYRATSDVVHLTVPTVMKHITKLMVKQFITVQNISYSDRQVMKQNGNNQYTILPIWTAMDRCSRWYD